jgi:DNA-binding response OmpR family regulator
VGVAVNGRILIVDDDRGIQSSLARHLAKEGFYPVQALSAEMALDLLKTQSFDLMLLDLGLPDLDGISFCRRIRQQWKLPIIILTARSDSYDKVVGLEVGADDYVTKPFGIPELLARIRAQLRRNQEYSHESEKAPQQKVLGNVVLDEALHDARVEGNPVGLTAKEFDLFWLLANHPGRALEKYWIFEQVWGYDADLGIKILAVYIRRLREKLENDPNNPTLIQTVRGFGYRLANAELLSKDVD